MLIERAQSCVLLIDVQEKLFPLIHQSGELLKKLEWITKLTEFLQVPIFTTEQYPQGLGGTLPELKKYTQEAAYEKLTFSIMGDDTINDAVETMDATDLIVVGIESHVCVMQSVLDLLETEKNIYVVNDCIGARNEKDHLLALDRMKDMGAEIVSREMVLFEWLRQAGTDEFKSVSKAFLQG